MHIILVALALFFLEWRVIKDNIGTPWNGYGAMGGTLARCNRAPARYRTLAPWLVGWIPEPWRLLAYCLLKFGLLAGMLATGEAVLGTPGMLLLAVLTACTFEFDYWDCYAETLAVLLCLTGNFWLALLGGAIWALSKETFLLAPLLAGLAGGIAPGVGALIGAGLLYPAMRIWQGKATLYGKRSPADLVDLYGERWSFRIYNVPDVKRAWKTGGEGPFLSVLWTVTTIICAIIGTFILPAPLARTAWLSLAWLGAGWLLARARETRVFLPTAIWIAAVLT